MQACQMQKDRLDLVETQYARPSQQGGYGQMFYELLAHIKFLDRRIELLVNPGAEKLSPVVGEVELPKAAATIAGPVVPKKTGKGGHLAKGPG